MTWFPSGHLIIHYYYYLTLNNINLLTQFDSPQSLPPFDCIIGVWFCFAFYYVIAFAIAPLITHINHHILLSYMSSLSNHGYLLIHDITYAPSVMVLPRLVLVILVWSCQS